VELCDCGVVHRQCGRNRNIMMSMKKRCVLPLLKISRLSANHLEVTYNKTNMMHDELTEHYSCDIKLLQTL
jgi:hypothetical protein